MYPPKNPDEGRAAVSQDNARDIVNLIDQIIIARILQYKTGQLFDLGTNENVEVMKRTITDYLLVTDPRAGVFKKPE